MEILLKNIKLWDLDLSNNYGWSFQYNLADIFANNIIDLFLTSAFPSSVNFLQIGTIYLIHYILFNLSFGLSST